MTKRIGILTFQDADNFGAVLQAYALCEVLKQIRNDIDVEIINYKCKKVLANTSLHENISKRGILKGLYKYPQMIAIHKRFDSFRDTYLPRSNVFCSVEELKNEIMSYDAVISGSDQVWNLALTGNDTVYFQDFFSATGKKYSYAASMGGYWIADHQYDWFINVLKDFETISLREETTSKKLNELGITSRVDLDPTLLLGKEKWSHFASNKYLGKDYILLYMVPFQKSVVAKAEEIHRDTGMPVLLVSKSLKPITAKHAGNISPTEFVGAFRDARYVVTNSFHGTAFSIIFQKDCSICLQTPTGFNTRAADLLKKCGIDFFEDFIDVRLSGERGRTITERLSAPVENSISYLWSIIR